MGGRPAERCRSEALFLTEKARSSAISIGVPRTVEAPRMRSRRVVVGIRLGIRVDYVHNTRQPASRAPAYFPKRYKGIATPAPSCTGVNPHLPRRAAVV